MEPPTHLANLNRQLRLLKVFMVTTLEQLADMERMELDTAERLAKRTTNLVLVFTEETTMPSAQLEMRLELMEWGMLAFGEIKQTLLDSQYTQMVILVLQGLKRSL